MLLLLLHASCRLARRSFRSSYCLPVLSLLFLLSGCTAYHPATTTSSSEPAIALSATSFNFKTVVVGQTVNQTLNVSNPGKAPLQISSLALSDQQFVISGPSVPRTVLPNMSVQYTLAFTPTAAGNASAALTIKSNALDPVSSVSLAGVGEKVIATIAVTPASISFGNETLQTTTSKNVVVQNTGDINLTLSGITVVGAGFGYSDLSPGFSLAPNQSVTFQVWFKPTAKGAASGTLSILSANLSSPAELALAGDGVPPGTSTPPPTAPTTPVQHTVHLTWNASSSTIAGYRVYRSATSNGGLQPISSSLVSATDYDDSTVDSGTTYYYAVTAVNSAGEESTDSNEATAVVPAP